MRIRHTAIIGILIAAAVLVLSTSAACGQEDHERIAEEVAREWTMNEADVISEEIAAMATRLYGSRVYVEIVHDSPSSSSNVAPAGKTPYEGKVSMWADADQIQEMMKWDFRLPTKTEDGRYEIIATVSVSFDIAASESSEIPQDIPPIYLPLFRMPHSGSVDYTLEIDTTKREVTAAKKPLYSIHMSGIPQVRNLN